MLVTIDGKKRISLYAVAYLDERGESPGVVMQNGERISLTQEEFEALATYWDEHSEHIKLGNADGPDTLPMPPGQAEREFNLGDE